MLFVLSRYRQKFFWVFVFGVLNIGLFGVYIVTGGHRETSNGADKVYAMGLLVSACMCTIFNLSISASHYYTRHSASLKMREHHHNFNETWNQIQADQNTKGLIEELAAICAPVQEELGKQRWNR